MLDSNNWIQNTFDESTFSRCRDWVLKIQKNWLKSPMIMNWNRNSKVCHWSTFGWALRKEYRLLAGKATTTFLPFSTTYLCEKHFLPMQIWNPSTETDSMQNCIWDFIFLRWYRTTEHYAEQNKRILHTESFIKVPTGYDRFHSYM
jgi:hypothetical protein